MIQASEKYVVFGFIPLKMDLQGNWSAARMGWLVRILTKLRRLLGKKTISLTPVAS